MSRQRTRFRSFVALFALGYLGIVALVVDGLLRPGQFEEVAAAAGISVEVLVLASTLQSAMFLALAVVVGMFTAPKLGFTSRVYDRVTEGAPIGQSIRADVRLGLVGGAVVGLLLVASEVVSQRLLELGGQEMTVELLVQSIPLRLLYGGITEELLLRWGVMSLFAFVLWRLAGDTRSDPSPAITWTAIIASAVAFGVLHLPAATAIYGGLTPGLIAFIVSANAIAGLVFGWLFWRYSLEAGMIAHVTAHALAVSVWLVTLVV